MNRDIHLLSAALKPRTYFLFFPNRLHPSILHTICAGKTLILYRIGLGEVTTTSPTTGFNIEEVKYSDGIQFTSWDLGGADRIDSLWRHYYLDMKGIVFVLDSNENDDDRWEQTRYWLQKLLSEELLCGAPVLIFANKQDLPNAISITDITDKMRLHTITGRQWYIQGCSATTGDGLYEGMDWLKDVLRNSSTARDVLMEGVREKHMEKEREMKQRCQQAENEARKAAEIEAAELKAAKDKRAADREAVQPAWTIRDPFGSCVYCLTTGCRALCSWHTPVTLKLAVSPTTVAQLYALNLQVAQIRSCTLVQGPVM